MPSARYRGKSLRSIRESKEIDLRQIATQTRIRISYLEDLEGERYSRFPGKFYFRSFSWEYARMLGLDPDVVIKDLLAAYDEWSRGNMAQEPTYAPYANQGPFHRIANYFRGVERSFRRQSREI